MGLRDVGEEKERFKQLKRLSAALTLGAIFCRKKRNSLLGDGD